MDAHEMMAEVVSSEQRLRGFIQKQVDEEIKLLIERTGLEITGMHMNFVDTTCMSTYCKNLTLSNVEIDVCLPDKL